LRSHDRIVVPAGACGEWRYHVGAARGVSAPCQSAWSAGSPKRALAGELLPFDSITGQE
jgi:hypothetical protein